MTVKHKQPGPLDQRAAAFYLMRSRVQRSRAADDLGDGDRGFDMVFFEEGGDGFGDFAAAADRDKRLVIAAFERH